MSIVFFVFRSFLGGSDPLNLLTEGGFYAIITDIKNGKGGIPNEWKTSENDARNQTEKLSFSSAWQRRIGVRTLQRPLLFGRDRGRHTGADSASRSLAPHFSRDIVLCFELRLLYYRMENTWKELYSLQYGLLRLVFTVLLDI